MMVICSNPAPCALLAQLNNSKNWSAANLTGERAKDHFNSNVKNGTDIPIFPYSDSPHGYEKGERSVGAVNQGDLII
jgi:hypothetical protein